MYRINGLQSTPRPPLSEQSFRWRENLRKIVSKCFLVSNMALRFAHGLHYGLLKPIPLHRSSPMTVHVANHHSRNAVFPTAVHSTWNAVDSQLVTRLPIKSMRAHCPFHFPTTNLMMRLQFTFEYTPLKSTSSTQCHHMTKGHWLCRL